MTATALVLEVPEAEPVVSRWRARYDPSATAGMPAHVTLVYPFRPFEQIDVAAETALIGIFSPTKPFDLRFGSTRRFPGVLWLAPEDPGPIVLLIEKLVAEFPDCRPYGGAYREIVPHLTVADLHRDQAPEQLLDRIRNDFHREAASRLPIQVRIGAASLYDNAQGQWRARGKFPFEA
jgi:2'-5' RNA ligase